MRPRPDRAGYSLVELIVALLITTLMGTVMLGLLLAQLALARVTAQRALTAEATRTALQVVGGEVRRALPADVRAVSADSLAMRSFRGTGIICAVMADQLHLRYRGDRLPDASKDSALLLPSQRAASIIAASPASHACSARAGEAVVTLRVAGSTAGQAAALVFESGAYFLSTGALRYRLGAEGRQPVTADLFLHPQTRFHSLPRGIGMDISYQRPHIRTFTSLYAPH